jgi:hypothetical protein
MADPMSDLEKRLAELRKEVLKRGFDRHASRLNNISELPIELQSPVVTALAARETIQTIVMFPQQIQRGWEYVPKQALLFTASGVIHLFASIWPDQEPQITRVEGCNLLYMKITLILLYGSLEIVARGENAPVRLSMEFNTVSWTYLSAPLQRFLQLTQVASFVNNSPCSSITQQLLTELPLKFLNGVRIHGLLPGEELKELVFQSATWERWLYFLRRPFSANILLLLTNHYMVVIQEELNVKQGWLISYIPRHNIAGIQSQPCGSWNELSVQLKQGSQAVAYKLTLKNETAESWRTSWIQHGNKWENLPERRVDHIG